MTIVEEVERLTDLLSGLNYEVFVDIERVALGVASSPPDVIGMGFPGVPISKPSLCDPRESLATMKSCLTYRGNFSHGPDVGVIESADFKTQLSFVCNHFMKECDSACDVHEFRFVNSETHYSVYWGFSFVLRFEEYSDVWVGSCFD